MKIPIMHRDISIGNILLRWNPVLKEWQGFLTDWEIATDFTPRCNVNGKPEIGCVSPVFHHVQKDLPDIFDPGHFRGQARSPRSVFWTGPLARQSGRPRTTWRASCTSSYTRP